MVLLYFVLGCDLDWVLLVLGWFFCGCLDYCIWGRCCRVSWMRMIVVLGCWWLVCVCWGRLVFWRIVVCDVVYLVYDWWIWVLWFCWLNLVWFLLNWWVVVWWWFWWWDGLLLFWCCVFFVFLVLVDWLVDVLYCWFVFGCSFGCWVYWIDWWICFCGYVLLGLVLEIECFLVWLVFDWWFVVGFGVWFVFCRLGSVVCLCVYIIVVGSCIFWWWFWLLIVGCGWLIFGWWILLEIVFWWSWCLVCLFVWEIGGCRLIVILCNVVVFWWRWCWMWVRICLIWIIWWRWLVCCGVGWGWCCVDCVCVYFWWLGG